MATISTANFLIETKRIAKIIDLFNTAIGDGDDANTPSKGGANALAAIAALGDNDQLTALLPSAVIVADALKQANYYGALYPWLLKLDAHVGGINDYLNDNSLHIHFNCKTAYPVIQVRHIFPPVTDFGSMAVSGAGAGTWTGQDSVDTSLYGDGLIEIVTESVIGAADIILTITGLDFDGNVVDETCTIPNATGNDTTIAVDGTDRFVSVDADPTFTGGTAADAFRIQTKFDRTPSGCA